MTPNETHSVSMMMITVFETYSQYEKLLDYIVEGALPQSLAHYLHTYLDLCTKLLFEKKLGLGSSVYCTKKEKQTMKCM